MKTVALEGDGTAQSVSGTQNLQFYIPKDVRTDDKFPFAADDEFEVRILPHAGIVITPPDIDVTLADVLAGLGVGYPSRAETLADCDPRDIPL